MARLLVDLTRFRPSGCFNSAPKQGRRGLSTFGCFGQAFCPKGAILGQRKPPAAKKFQRGTARFVPQFAVVNGPREHASGLPPRMLYKPVELALRRAVCAVSGLKKPRSTECLK